MIPFGPFEPDRSAFTGTSSNNVINAQPVADGWGPMPSYAEISQALADTCVGAVYVRDSTGNYTIVAGTTTRLYKLNTTDYSWTDISGPSAPYAVPLGDAWTFTVFGTQLLIHNITNPIQVYNIESGGVCADLAGNPPKAKYSWVAGDFVVLGYLAATRGEKQVQWSGINDATWWTIGQKGCDFQELPEGNEVMGGFSERGGFTVIQRSGMQSFPFAPSTGFTFTRTVLNPKQGTVSPRSIVSIGPSQFFYLSEDGFFGGADRQAIGGERVDKWFLTQIDARFLGDVQGAADPYEKIVWWKYQTPNGEFRRLGYDWQLDRWCTTDLQVGEMVALTTPGTTWDGLDLLYPNIAAVDVPFDSRIFLGGRPTMATFTTGNKLAFFSGANLEATIDTADVVLDPTQRTFVSGARVVTDAPTFTVSDGVSDYHGGAITFSSANAPNRAGLVPFRSDGRLHKLRLSIPEGTSWSIVSSIDVNAVASGGQ